MKKFIFHKKLEGITWKYLPLHHYTSFCVSLYFHALFEKLTDFFWKQGFSVTANIFITGNFITS